jgi:hypothetical protein
MQIIKKSGHKNMQSPHTMRIQRAAALEKRPRAVDLRRRIAAADPQSIIALHGLIDTNTGRRRTKQLIWDIIRLDILAAPVFDTDMLHKKVRVSQTDITDLLERWAAAGFLAVTDADMFCRTAKKMERIAPIVSHGGAILSDDSVHNKIWTAMKIRRRFLKAEIISDTKAAPSTVKSFIALMIKSNLLKVEAKPRTTVREYVVTQPLFNDAPKITGRGSAKRLVLS